MIEQTFPDTSRSFNDDYPTDTDLTPRTLTALLPAASSPIMIISIRLALSSLTLMRRGGSLWRSRSRMR